MDIDPLKASDGKPFDATDVVGLMGMRRGFAAIMKQGESFTMQKFKWGSRSPKAYGKRYDITSKIGEYEIEADKDFNGDQVIGENDNEDDLEIKRVVFPGSDEFDVGLYEVKEKGSLILAEMDLRPGETPFEDEAILDRSGKPYAGGKAVGLYQIKRGFALLEQQADGRLTKQGFREKRGNLRAFGKPRRAQRLCKYEQKMEFDFDNNQVIGCFNDNRGGNLAPVKREAELIALADLVDPLS